MGTSKEEEAGVHVGTGGVLFLSGGRHSVFPFFTGEKDPRPKSAANFVGNLGARAD